jgi:energy-coupling factor transporter ATP-binding protein EcfA2
VDLVTRIEIENFRSIDSLATDTGALTAFIGTNGSGKSNILRALNLFFNGELEPGVPLDISRDFHKPWRRIGNRVIDVSLTFSLPDVFGFNQPLVDPLAAIGITPGTTFEIRRRWQRDKLREGATTDEFFIRSGANWGAALQADQAGAALRFLQLIRFRYIPNHVHPSELLQAESAALQQSLITALRLRRARQPQAGPAVGDVDALLREMATAAQDLVLPLTAVLSAAPGHIQGIEIETPSDWAEVAWSLGLRLQAKDVRPLDAAMHGSGNQTFLMYLLIHFIDTQFRQGFGWRQATIWAIEEPESFLHADLKHQLASFLVDATRQPRFLALVTTHDLLFAGAADLRHEVGLEGGETTAQQYEMSELADRTLASGVTGYVHPLALTQPKPTLIVDGPFDVFYLEQAYRKGRRLNPWDIRCLETLDPDVGGSGKDKLKQYLKNSKGGLRARPSTSPVVVLLDWEDSENERLAFAQLVSEHPTSTAVVWPQDLSNPRLGSSFRGIERFLGTPLIEHVANQQPNLGITQTVANPPIFGLHPPSRSAVKQALVRECRGRDDVQGVQPLIDALNWLDSNIPGRAQQPRLPSI